MNFDTLSPAARAAIEAPASFPLPDQDAGAPVEADCLSNDRPLFKFLADYSDEEIAREYGWRVLRRLASRDITLRNAQAHETQPNRRLHTEGPLPMRLRSQNVPELAGRRTGAGRRLRQL